MLYMLIKICMGIFIAFCILTLCAWVYETYTAGFSWNNTSVYAKSFLVFLIFSLVSYWIIKNKIV